MTSGGGIGGGIEVGAISAPPVPAAPVMPAGLPTPGAAPAEIQTAVPAVVEAPSAPALPIVEPVVEGASPGQQAGVHADLGVQAIGQDAKPGDHANVVANVPAEFNTPPAEAPVAGQPAAASTPEGTVPLQTAEPGQEGQPAPENAEKPQQERVTSTRTKLRAAEQRMDEIRREMATASDQRLAELSNQLLEEQVRVNWLTNQDNWERKNLSLDERIGILEKELGISADRAEEMATKEVLQEAIKLRDSKTAGTPEFAAADRRVMLLGLKLQTEAWDRERNNKAEPPQDVDVRDHLTNIGVSTEVARHLNMQFAYELLNNLWQDLSLEEASERAFSTLAQGIKTSELPKAEGMQEGQEHPMLRFIKRILTEVLKYMLQAAITAITIEATRAQQQTAPITEPGGAILASGAEESITPPPASTEVPSAAPVATPAAPVIPVTPVAA